MSIFGELDAANIPSNPYFIEKGDYPAVISKAEFKTSRDGQRQMTIEFTIDDSESEFNDQKITKYFNLVAADMTAAKLEALPAEEKAKVRKANASLKRWLMGNENNSSQKGLGVSVEEMNDRNWDPKTLLHKKVTIGITNYGANNEGVNLNWANLRDED